MKPGEPFDARLQYYRLACPIYLLFNWFISFALVIKVEIISNEKKSIVSGFLII